MTVTYTAPEAGEEMVYQNVEQLINGLTGASMVSHSMFNDHATQPALTLKSTHATGTPLSIQNPAGTEMVSVKNFVSATDGSSQKILLSSVLGTLTLHTGAGVGGVRADAHHHTVMNNFFYDNQYPAGGSDLPDVATFGIQGHQSVGADAYFRALEVDMISKATVTGTWPKVGIELSIESAAVGNGIDQTVGLSLKNMGSLWIGAGAASKRIDSFIMAGADSHGATNLIHYRDTAGAGAGLLYKVDQQGDVYSGDQFPRANATYTLGTLGTEWLASYVRQYVATIGAGANVKYSLTNGSETGLSEPVANAIGHVNNSVETIRITAAGLLDFRNPGGVHFIGLGGGAGATLGTAGGSGPAASGQNAWLKIMNAGSAVFIPVWI